MSNDRIQKMEKLLEQVEKDNKYLKDIKKQLKNIEKNYKDLSNYYQNEWIEDYENSNNNEKNYKLLNQDSVWNCLEEQYNQKVNILKNITKNL